MICSPPNCFFALARTSQATQSNVAMETDVWRQLLPCKTKCGSLSHTMVLHKIQREVYQSLSRLIQNKYMLWGWDSPTVFVSNIFRPIWTINKFRSIYKKCLTPNFPDLYQFITKGTLNGPRSMHLYKIIQWDEVAVGVPCLKIANYKNSPGERR